MPYTYSSSLNRTALPLREVVSHILDTRPDLVCARMTGAELHAPPPLAPSPPGTALPLCWCWFPPLPRALLPLPWVGTFFAVRLLHGKRREAAGPSASRRWLPTDVHTEW